jgi:hypothetical protein
MMVKTTGRGWAYLGVALGGAVSIAASVAHSYVPPPDASPAWAPHSGAVVGAVFWPVALFVAVEIFARTAWPAERRWAALRWCGLLPVALVAAVVSYRHLSGLLVFYGEDALTARIGPLAVDGLMVMATGALIATGARRLPVIEAVTSVAKTQVALRIRAARLPARKTAPKAAKVAATVAARPDLSTTEAARLAGVSPRTARRVVNGARAADVLAEVSS